MHLEIDILYSLITFNAFFFNCWIAYEIVNGILQYSNVHTLHMHI